MRLVVKKGIVQLTKAKEKEMKISQGKIKKLKQEIEKWVFNGLIIDRSKSQEQIDTKIDRLSDEFRKTESSDWIHGLKRDGGKNPA